LPLLKFQPSYKTIVHALLCVFNGFWSEVGPLLLKHVAAVNTTDNVVLLKALYSFILFYFILLNNLTIIHYLLNSITAWSRVILQKPTITQADFLKYLEDGRSEVIRNISSCIPSYPAS